ncbi:serine protease [Donghicola sp. XS_ASV15]|uniref:trypsin-like serine peptidase n=1 Tax=Donghicola sp. XS_ASV15 TaxID=3241295 RepID=UPI003519183A
MRRLWALLLCGAGSATAQDVPVLEAFVDGQIEERKIWIDKSQWLGDRGAVWSDEISLAGADYIRLLLRTEGASFPDDARLVIFGAMDQSLEVGLAAIPEAGQWTPLLPFGRARLALVSDSRLPDTAALVIESIAIQSTKIARYSTYGENQLTPINNPEVPEEFQALGPPVALLSFVEGGFARTCSGFLIGSDQLMTNEHCIRDQETCASMTAVFGYEYDQTGRLGIGAQATCAGVDLLRMNPALDVSVVTLDRPMDDAYGLVEILPMETVPEMPMVVVQHSGSQPKQISMLDCTAGELRVAGRGEATDFTHTCDTSGGSSGAPVFDRQGRLVGLHHFGFQDGDAWDSNRAVHLDLIADWLNTAAEDKGE